MARQKGLFGRAFDKIKQAFAPTLEPVKKPRPVKKAPAPIFEKPKPRFTPEERTAQVLNGTVNPRGNELVTGAGEKHYNTTKARPHKIQIEYYNGDNDEPSWITGQQRKPYTTENIIELFQHHSEHGIEGSDEEPFNVTRARIWMN